MADKKKKKTKPQARKILKELMAKGHKLTRRNLPALEECAEVFGDGFPQEVGKLGLLEVAVQHGQDDIVALLLDRGVDPNALPDKATSAARALGRPFARGSRLKEPQRVALCTRLLEAGADPNDVYPHPKHATYTRPAWATRKSALDLALEQRSDAVPVLMAADLSEVTRTSAMSIAAHRGSRYAPSPKPSDAAHARSLALFTELLGKFGTSSATDRWGAHPVQIAAITANVEALRMLLEQGAPVDVRLADDLSYSDDRHLAPLGSDSLFKSVQFPAGSGLLDLTALIRRHLESQLDLARTDDGLHYKFEDLPARLAHLDEVEALLRTHGAEATGATVQIPEFAKPIDAVLAPIVGERYAERLHEVDFGGLGPWTYLIAVGELFRDELAAVAPLIPIDPVAFVLLGEHTKKVVARYNDPDYRQDEIDVQLDPEDYPEPARKLLRHWILGMQGDDVLVLERASEGARLHRVGRQGAKDEGTLYEGLLEAFAERVASRA
jgi:hypothetical protein